MRPRARATHCTTLHSCIHAWQPCTAATHGSHVTPENAVLPMVAAVVVGAAPATTSWPTRCHLQVADKPVRKSPRGIVRDSDEAIREQRKQKRLAAAAAAAAAAHAVAGGAAPGDDAGGDLSEGEPEGSQGGEGGGGEEGQAGDEGGDGEGEVEGEGGAALGGRGGAGEKAMCAP